MRTARVLLVAHTVSGQEIFMIGRGFAALRIGFVVVFNALGLLALLGAAWLMPSMLELLFKVAGTG